MYSVTFVPSVASSVILAVHTSDRHRGILLLIARWQNFSMKNFFLAKVAAFLRKKGFVSFVHARRHVFTQKVTYTVKLEARQFTSAST